MVIYLIQNWCGGGGGGVDGGRWGQSSHHRWGWFYNYIALVDGVTENERVPSLLVD